MCLTSDASNCVRRSGPVSMSTVVGTDPPPKRSISKAQRKRRFLGSFGSHAPQSLPIRGTPGEDTQPRIVVRSLAINPVPSGNRRVSMPWYLTEKPEKIVRGHGCQRLGGYPADIG